MGHQFVDPPAFDLDAVYNTSSPKTPLIFVLSPGVDPTNTLLELATKKGVAVGNCALGQGQGPKAASLFDEGCSSGKWVFLSNCHLMLSWMPTLEKRIEAIRDGSTSTNPAFRLWLVRGTLCALCVTLCYFVLLCVTFLCYFVLLCVTLCYFVLLCVTLCYFLLLCVTLYYSVLLCMHSVYTLYTLCMHSMCTLCYSVLDTSWLLFV
jgi:hypothetical protein